MNKYNRDLAKNTVILGIGQVVPKALGIVILPILTTYLSTSDYGIFDLVLSYAGLLIPIITMQLQQAVFRFLLLSLEKKKKTEYVSSVILYVVIASVIVLSVVFIILHILQIDLSISLLICFMFFAETLYNLFGQVVRGLGFNLKYSISVIIFSIVNVIAIVFFVIFVKLELSGVLISWTIAYVIADIYMLFPSGIIKYISIRECSSGSLKELLRFSVPIVPSSISLWIVNLSDRIIVSNYLGNGANGIYAIANRIPLLYNTAFGMFNLAWIETASRVSDDGNQEEYYTNLFASLFKFLVGIMLLMIAITPILFSILIKGEYKVAIYQVPILYIGAFFNSFINFYSGIYIALKRTKQVGISSIAGAVINIAINILLINRVGLYAASLSTAVSFFVIALYRAYDLSKVIKINYNTKEIIGGIIVLLFCCFLLYIGGGWNIAFCFLIACVYNLQKNSYFLHIIIKILIKK